MVDFVQKYKETILFIWGLSMLTIVVLLHLVINPYVYFILGAALGAPIFLGLRKNGEKKP